MACRNCGGKRSTGQYSYGNEYDKVKKPNHQYDLTAFTHIMIIAFVGNTKSCADTNRHVDYILHWLVEDNLRCEKYGIENRLASKFGITTTPTIVLKTKDKIHKFGIRGVAVAYKTILEELSKF